MSLCVVLCSPLLFACGFHVAACDYHAAACVGHLNEGHNCALCGVGFGCCDNFNVLLGAFVPHLSVDP